MWNGGGFDTWLYNQNNKMYLEITHIYTWLFRKPKKAEKFIPFDQWIQHYKPLALVEIDKAIAQQWLEQAGKLMKEIKKADEKYLHVPQEQ